MRPKLFVGRFAPSDYGWWNDRTPGIDDALWGGEIAGALLTKHLTPATATIYVHDRTNELIVKHGLRKNFHGKVEILNAFWGFKHPGHDLATVHPLLVFADLVATGDPRNIDTAKIINDKQLARYLRED